MSNIDKRALRDSTESTIGILESIADFEPSYIDGDVVELRFEAGDGFDTGCDVSIVDQCQKAADVVRALLDELEAKGTEIEWMRKRIEELAKAREVSEEQRANWFQMAEKLGADLDAAEKRIAEMESRESVVIIKPPVIGRAYSALNRVWTEQEVRKACKIAGIKLHIAAAGKGE